MTWFQRIFARQNTGPPHIGENCSRREMSRRLGTLSEDEQKAYNWLFSGYSENWTAETLGLERPDAKALFSQIYRKLGIENAREIIQYYAPEGLFIKEHLGVDTTDGHFEEEQPQMIQYHSLPWPIHGRTENDENMV